MQTPTFEDPKNTIANIARARLDRRNFLRKAGVFGLGAAASGLVLASGKPAYAQQENQAEQMQDFAQNKDTVMEIATAALVAEDLATTFYYNGLVGQVIQNPSLAGAGGSATNVTSAGNLGNVMYLRAALSEEISHANLIRTVLNLPNWSKDPIQTFYFPAGSFNTLAAFTGLLNALENAFIGAYLNAIQELSHMAATSTAGGPANDSGAYPRETLLYYAKVVGSILGVECEHRVLGRVISNSNPANNWNYEQTDGINAVYNGPNSAVAALTPFITPSTGPGYSFAQAVQGAASVSVPVSGAPPTY